MPYLNIVVMSLRPPAVGAPYAPGLHAAATTRRSLSDAYLLGVLGDTLLLGLTTTLICLLLGYPLAYHLARTKSRWKSILYVLRAVAAAGRRGGAQLRLADPALGQRRDEPAR